MNTTCAASQKLAESKTASAFELGKDLFGKYASSDDSGSTNRHEHLAVGLNAKYENLQQQTKLNSFMATRGSLGKSTREEVLAELAAMRD